MNRRPPIASLSFLLVLVAAVCLLADSTQAQDPKKKPTLVEQVGDMELNYDMQEGVRLVVHGMEIIRGNSLWVMRPGWSGRVYGIPDSPSIFVDPQVEELDGGGKRIELDLRKPQDTPSPFTGTLVLTMTPDNRIEWDLRFVLEEGTEAILEWGVAQLNATPLIGKPYEATTWDGQQIEGTVFVEAPSSDPDESTLAMPIRELTIDSRIGPITITSNEQAGLRLFDYRKNTWAMDGKPIFWLGRLGHDIPTEREVHYAASIDFPDRVTPDSETVEQREATVASTETDVALRPAPREVPLIPTPKIAEMTDERLLVSTRGTKIYVGEEPSRETDKAVAFLMRDLREKFALYPEIVRKSPPEPLPAGAIVIGERGRLDAAEAMIEGAGLSVPEDEEEGYALLVSGDAAAIAAETGRGIFYGVTTLVQLLEATEEGVGLQGARITDWPSLDFRGVHALSGKDRGGEIAKAVRDLLARYKMNTFVWETEYIIWNTHPDIAHPEFGMTKTDAAQVVQAAEENLVEMIPLVQSLGHSDYIFVHGHNMEIAEDPATPYAYMPENPDTYAFIFDLYEEAIEFFNHPRLFHIGHDEVTMTGRFPYRSRESGKDAYTLVMEDIWRLHEFFSERDIRMMMWSDMFLAEEEAPDATFADSVEQAQRLRSELPDDVFITDWHYAPVTPEEMISLELWLDEGFEVVGCPWYNPINIRSQALASIAAGASGLLQTTWAGFNFMIDGNESSWFQYWVYILAAHYAWSGDTAMPDELSWTPREVFLDTWYGDMPLTRKREGFTIDLAPLANRSRTDSGAGDGWLGFGEALDLAALDLSRTQFGETRFELAQNEEGNSALMLAGWLNPEGTFPRRAMLEFDEPHRAEEFRFLMASAFSTAEKRRAGSITAHFANGERETLDLVYGENIFAPSEDRVGRDARIAWKGETASGDTIRLWNLRWQLENTGSPVERLELTSANTEAAPVFFAITGVAPLE